MIILTLGNVDDKGSHVDKAITPANICGDVNAKNIKKRNK